MSNEEITVFGPDDPEDETTIIGRCPNCDYHHIKRRGELFECDECHHTWDPNEDG